MKAAIFVHEDRRRFGLRRKPKRNDKKMNESKELPAVTAAFRRYSVLDNVNKCWLTLHCMFNESQNVFPVEQAGRWPSRERERYDVFVRLHQPVRERAPF